MSFISQLSIKTKIGLGILLSYTSFEVYMQIRTQQIISERREEFKKFTNSKDSDVSKFKSVSVAGMFVNPFEEYRPQTAFEFLFVRIMELLESFYGNKIELHDKLPQPKDGAVEVEDLLKLFKPDKETMRKNSIILQTCIKNDDFSALSSPAAKSWLERTESNNSSSIDQQMLFTWLGQSCALVQISGINFLTDPTISDHLISPNLGPKRLTKSPMNLDDIMYSTNDKINFMLVSHDHPDHLEMDLVKKVGNKTTWIVPLGLKRKLAAKGIYNILELDWWESADITSLISTSENFKDKYEVVCVPAMHWSGRYILDSNQSLWCSFIIRRNNESILYHAGDTGYSNELFKVIGKKFGPVFMGMLPIGQYCPSWHQKPRHISPEESLQICKDLQISKMKGIHWGTFKLSGEPILEPKNLLIELAKQAGKSLYYGVPEFGLTYLYNVRDRSEIELHI
ncbi:beta-lactamase superfamily domain-containing protein [Scheffersomyces coipomensis]|uniref:beta-lactamase superfamily domain-containing protein n=1 Tax=Scheffersomyces coipomensis TaxID=1788519 RepID=UPI00315DE620